MDAEHEDMGNNHGMRRRFVEACEKEIDTDDLRNGSTGQVLSKGYASVGQQTKLQARKNNIRL